MPPQIENSVSFHTSSASATITIDVSSLGTVDGEKLVAQIEIRNVTPVISDFAGWTLEEDNSGTGIGRLYTLTKDASSEGSSYTWTASGSAQHSIVIARVSGVASGAIHNSAGIYNGTSDTSLDFPAITTTAACFLLYVGASGVNTTVTDFLGLTGSWDTAAGTTTTARQVMGAYTTQGASGTDAARSVTIGTAANSIGHVLALEPSAAAAEPSVSRVFSVRWG